MGNRAFRALAIFSILLPELLMMPPEGAFARTISRIGVGAPFYDATHSEVTLALTGRAPRLGVHRNGNRVVYLDLTAPGRSRIQILANHSYHLRHLGASLTEIRLGQYQRSIVRLAVESSVGMKFAPSLMRTRTGWQLRVVLLFVEPPVRPSRSLSSTITPSLPPTPAPPHASKPVSPISKTVPTPSASNHPASPSAQTFSLPTSAIASRSLEHAPKPSFHWPSIPWPSFRPDLHLGYAYANLNENYAAGGSQTNLSGNDVYLVQWNAPWSKQWQSEWCLRQWAPYEIVDSQLVNSHHLRTETWLQAKVARLLNFGRWSERLSAGYLLRYVKNTSSMAAPSPSYLFSSYQLYQGPELAGETQVELLGPLRAVFDLSTVPLAFVSLDSNVPTLGPLNVLGTAAGLEMDWGKVEGRVDYRYQDFQQSGAPIQEISAPEFTVGYQF